MSTFGCILHIYNEELLLPFWLEHHWLIFDQIKIIDYNSTDGTKEILEKLDPWLIDRYKSKNSNFAAVDCDKEVMEYEEQLTTDWKIALTTTEFLWTRGYSQILERYGKENQHIQAFGGVCYSLVDKDLDKPLVHPLWKDHTFGSIINKATNVHPRIRYAHRAPNGIYTPGRHTTLLPSMVVEELALLHWRYAPWPQAVDRKLAIKSQVPQTDINSGMGTHHKSNRKELDEDYNLWLKESNDLMLDDRYREIYNSYDKV